jgi:thioredoxin reductase (NADPH)
MHDTDSANGSANGRNLHDVTIIGTGPTGLFAAYYAGFRGLRVRLIDSMPEFGGQITALYPEKYIYDVAGFPRVLGKDLVRSLVEQALQYKPTVCLDEKVQEFHAEGPRLIRLGTNRGVHWTRTVFITVGLGMFTPRKLPNAALARFEGKGLAYFVRDREEYRGADLLVIGGGDSAFDWCLNLEGIARSITLIHRRDRFRAFEDSVKKVMESSVQVRTFTELQDIEGPDRVEGVIVIDTRSRQLTNLPVNRVLACLGFSSNLGPLKTWGLTLEDNAIVANTKGETNLPGVYAAGDVATYPGKVKLIATGFGEAATAVNNAAAYINPSLRVFPGHSSTLMDKPAATDTGE